MFLDIYLSVVVYRDKLTGEGVDDGITESVDSSVAMVGECACRDVDHRLILALGRGVGGESGLVARHGVTFLDGGP